MKLTNLFMLATVSLLVACGPVEEPIEIPQNSPLATPTEISVAIPFNSPVATPTPERADDMRTEPSWNTAPDALIVSATLCCGYVHKLVRENYIPDALIWGDGRIIWTQSTNSGERRVLEGYLTPDQMDALLQRVVADGFFDWQDKYVTYTRTDAAHKCLSVQLGQRSKQVCEYIEGAPQAFHDLYADIATGAGVAGAEYVPELGYLTAYPLDFSNQPAPQVELKWPADSAGFSLNEAVHGVWVEGEVLELAWAALNVKQWGMIVQDGDAYYQISVQIPGISLFEPPAR